MKQLLTLTALLLTFSGLAQQMPYNPDANGDDFVGLDEDGLQIDWREGTWVLNAEYFRVIPFWHEAE